MSTCWTCTPLLSVPVFHSRPRSVCTLKGAVMPFCSSWEGCSAYPLGWLLAQKQFSWMWESEIKVRTLPECVLVLLWERPSANEAHVEIQELGSAPDRRDGIWASQTMTATTLPCHICCPSPSHWTCHSNFVPKNGGCHGGDYFSTERSSYS